VLPPNPDVLARAARRSRLTSGAVAMESISGGRFRHAELLVSEWSRLGSNQRPPACEAGALPLSYETGAAGERRRRLTCAALPAERAARTLNADARVCRKICAVPL